jgi:CheY-like chemotaxis protein
MSANGKIMIIDDSEQLAECDLVLIDFHMPGIGGGEVLNGLRKAGKSMGAQPLYFLYTSDKTASRKHRDMGFDGALINKGDDESLVQQLAAALRFAKLRRMTR